MSDEAVWDDEDDQNVVGLIRICEARFGRPLS